MNRQRLAAVVLLSAVACAVLALLVYSERSSGEATVSVLVLTHDVAAGAPYSAADVAVEQIHAQPGDFDYETRTPSDYAARYASNLQAHDILRDDDLVPDAADSEIALTVQDPPPLQAGEHVDIYATMPDSGIALIGRDVVVEGVSGGALTVLVPAADEASWVDVTSSNVALHVALTVPGAQVAPAPGSIDSAIRLLCGSPCADSAPAAVTP